MRLRDKFKAWALGKFFILTVAQPHERIVGHFMVRGQIYIATDSRLIVYDPDRVILQSLRYL